MIFYLICFCLMRLLRSVLPGLLFSAGATAAFGQTGATPPAVLVPPAESAETAAHPLLLKVGLNAGRALRYGSYYGLSMQLPVTVGAEYALSQKFTVYGQVDADFRLSNRQNNFHGDPNFVMPSGAIGVGARYYYNQAGRIRQNRPHGPFVGNYLALEAHTEMRRRYKLPTDVSPGLNVVWGMQRRLSRNFLFDFNAGLGVSPVRSDANLGYSSQASGGMNFTTQFNLSIYFGR